MRWLLSTRPSTVATTATKATPTTATARAGNLTEFATAPLTAGSGVLAGHASSVG
jgi:hypothetical protein